MITIGYALLIISLSLFTIVAYRVYKGYHQEYEKPLRPSKPKLIYDEPIDDELLDDWPSNVIPFRMRMRDNESLDSIN